MTDAPEPTVLGDARDHRQAAAAALAATDRRRAVRERYRALVRGLEERGVVTVDRSRTAARTGVAAGAAVPQEAAVLREASDIFDEVVYGGRDVDDHDLAVLAAADRHALDLPAGPPPSASPRSRRAVPALLRSSRWWLCLLLALVVGLVLWGAASCDVSSSTAGGSRSSSTSSGGGSDSSGSDSGGSGSNGSDSAGSGSSGSDSGGSDSGSGGSSSGSGDGSYSGSGRARPDEVAGLGSHVPGPVWAALITAGFALAVIAMAAARRGWVPTDEPRPVVARGSEVVDGRAQLYRRSRDHAHLAAVLREAMCRRCAPRLGIDPDEPPADLAERLAFAAGRPVDEVAALLVATPGDDAELGELAQALAELERQVGSA